MTSGFGYRPARLSTATRSILDRVNEARSLNNSNYLRAMDEADAGIRKADRTPFTRLCEQGAGTCERTDQHAAH